MAATDPVSTMYAYEAYLLDTPTPRFGGSGRTFDWSLAAGFGHRAIVAGGLDASNVAEAIQTAHPWGVDACSRLESSPGKKDPQRVREFIRAAQIANSIWQEVSL
jgi:phosphoribosylanthranilate isomerase